MPLIPTAPLNRVPFAFRGGGHGSCPERSGSMSAIWPLVKNSMASWTLSASSQPRRTHSRSTSHITARCFPLNKAVRRVNLWRNSGALSGNARANCSHLDGVRLNVRAVAKSGHSFNAPTKRGVRARALGVELIVVRSAATPVRPFSKTTWRIA